MLIVACLFIADILLINTVFKPSPTELNLIIEVEDQVNLVNDQGLQLAQTEEHDNS